MGCFSCVLLCCFCVWFELLLYSLRQCGLLLLAVVLVDGCAVLGSLLRACGVCYR